MGIGIVVCGLNGVGKTTLGKALAEKLKFYFIDSEDLYFTDTSAQHSYSSQNTREQAEKFLMNKIDAHKNFILASVKGNYGEEVYPYFNYAVLIDVPKDIRLNRVRERSFERFGERILPDGDMYEQEKKFFDFVKSRAESTVEEWLNSLKCPVIRVDGTKPIDENVNFIIEMIQK